MSACQAFQSRFSGENFRAPSSNGMSRISMGESSRKRHMPCIKTHDPSFNPISDTIMEKHSLSSIAVSTSNQDEHMRLGIVLTAIQVIVFFSFVSLCTFHPALLQRDALGIGVPLSFLAGLSVIACGIVLTAIYVAVSNRLLERAE
ncbi:DUF485 domain-containing protein [Paraburkholderia silvatlantica]|uniref:DUF485 domain-containing protein n=1 Tax=Paraburkholderia silvatlantica TaxID=321895 RepID=UPI000DA1573A|nr:DUF485 domain-containing protein [Paraburkholderia silvatlantica]